MAASAAVDGLTHRIGFSGSFSVQSTIYGDSFVPSPSNTAVLSVFVLGLVPLPFSVPARTDSELVGSWCLLCNATFPAAGAFAGFDVPKSSVDCPAIGVAIAVGHSCSKLEKLESRIPGSVA